MCRQACTVGWKPWLLQHLKLRVVLTQLKMTEREVICGTGGLGECLWLTLELDSEDQCPNGDE